MHCISWSDYDSQPQIELKHGIRLDTTYYYWPPSWVNDQPGMFTGSGMPMRFTDRNGNLIDVYQATTQMTDESGQILSFQHGHVVEQRIRSERILRSVRGERSQRSGKLPWNRTRCAFVGPKSRCSYHFGSAVTDVAGWTQLLLLRLDQLERQHPQLQHQRKQPELVILQAMLPTNGPSGTLSSITMGGAPVTFTTQTDQRCQLCDVCSCDGFLSGSLWRDRQRSC